jgi:hypothetical protein
MMLVTSMNVLFLSSPIHIVLILSKNFLELNAPVFLFRYQSIGTRQVDSTNHIESLTIEYY